jgi:hypothetical protein
MYYLKEGCRGQARLRMTFSSIYIWQDLCLHVKMQTKESMYKSQLWQVIPPYPKNSHHFLSPVPGSVLPFPTSHNIYLQVDIAISPFYK